MKAYFDPNRPDFINIEGAKLQRDWSKFGGTTNTRGGMDYYFEIALDDENVANFLIENDYPVKIWNPKDKDPETHMKIALKYSDDPSKAWLVPTIKMFSLGSGNKEGVDITRENVNLLDTSVVDHCDITFRKYSGKTPMGQEYVQAQLVYGNFYVTGTKTDGGAYRPSYVGTPVEPAQTPKDDDLPF